MGDVTPRLGLPFILPGQAQKETFHNEALGVIDAVVHACVEEGPRNAPPDSPEEGKAWIVGLAASGQWMGEENSLAIWTAGGWRFVAPVVGTSAWNRTAGYWVHWLGDGWTQGEHPVRCITVEGTKVVGERQPAVPTPSGGTIIDQEARAAINAISVALRSHGLTE